MLKGNIIYIFSTYHNLFHAFITCGNAGKCLRSLYKQQLVQRLSQGKRKMLEAAIFF
jgi:hypothetical protein